MTPDSGLRLRCSVIAISANKTVVARNKSVKLPISGFYKFLILSLNFQQMPILPPHPADAHG